MTTVFEVGTPIPADVDRIFATAEVLLWRQGDQVHLAVRPAPAAMLREAALAGLSLRPSAVPLPTRPTDYAEAHGRDLRPLPTHLGTVDRIEIRPVPLGVSTAALLRRPIRGLPLSGRRRAACRALLRDEDAVYRVARVVWCPPASLRHGAYRRSLRPVVFDRGAGAPELERTAGSGDLTAWLRG